MSGNIQIEYNVYINDLYNEIISIYLQNTSVDQTNEQLTVLFQELATKIPDAGLRVNALLSIFYVPTLSGNDKIAVQRMLMSHITLSPDFLLLPILKTLQDDPAILAMQINELVPFLAYIWMDVKRSRDQVLEIMLKLLENLASDNVAYAADIEIFLIHFAVLAYANDTYKNRVIPVILRAAQSNEVFLAKLISVKTDYALRGIESHWPSQNIYNANNDLFKIAWQKCKDIQQQFWSNVTDKLIDEYNINQLRALACDNHDIELLEEIIARMESKDISLAAFITDLPSFRTIRVILGCLSSPPHNIDFENDPLWLKLKQVFAAESAKEILQQFTAEAIVGWSVGDRVSYKVMLEAAKLFNLEDRIKTEARRNRNFNPLLLSLERQKLDFSSNGIFAYYIQNYKQFDYITNPIDTEDKLIILKYLLVYSEQLKSIVQYEEYAMSLLSEDVIEKIDAEFISHILSIISVNNQPRPVPELLIKIVERLGYTFIKPYHIFYADQFWQYLQNPANIRFDTIRSLLAGAVHIDTLFPEYKSKTGIQSAHDEALARVFDSFVTCVIKDGSTQDQVRSIRIFILFDLYRTNPNAAIFNEVCKVALIKSIFEKNTQFNAFRNKLNKLSDEQLSQSGLLYVLNGSTEGINNRKRETLDAAINQQQTDDFAQQALLSLRAVRGKGDDVADTSYFLIDDMVRSGTLGLIVYCNMPVTCLRDHITSHEDIVAILYRLPREVEAESDKETGDRALLISLYMQNKDQPFKYEQYQQVLEKIWLARMEHNRNNICQYIAMSATEYSQASQSCAIGCKARMSTLLLGDMLFGPTRSRREDIEDCLYNVLRMQLKTKLEAVTTLEEKTEILATFLSTTASNAALCVAGKSDEMLKAYGTGHLKITSLQELFDTNDIDAVLMQIKNNFNNSDVYNIDGKHNLDEHELNALRVMLQMGGGIAVVKRLDTFFRSKYGNKDKKSELVDDIVRHIISLISNPTLLSQYEQAMLPRKKKNVAFLIMQLETGDQEADIAIYLNKVEQFLTLAMSDTSADHAALRAVINRIAAKTAAVRINSKYGR